MTHHPSSFQTEHFYNMKSNSPFDSDEFKMFSYKVDICPKNRSHDWTLCPFAHKGEKARRRDPVLFNYAPFACPKGDNCENGDACGLAHGVFEYWLHPAKYRTKHCNVGGECDRRVCFFAHNKKELRCEAMRMWYCIYKPYFGVGMDATELLLLQPEKECILPLSATKMKIDMEDGRNGLGNHCNNNKGVESVKSVGVWDMGFNLDIASILSFRRVPPQRSPVINATLNINN